MEVFDFTPSFVWEAVNGHNVLITEFESGKEQRRYKNRLPREWNLSFIDKQEQIAELKRFFNAHKGPFDVFMWRPPDEDEIIFVRFKENTINISSQGRFVSEVSLTLREVL
jgi:phage-related protein